MSEPGFIDRQKKFVTDQAKESAGNYFKDEEARLHEELKRIKETWLKKKEDDLNYIKEAFFYQYNLIAMCGLIALAAASGPLMPMIGAVAIAWEVLWLGMAPSSERFRRMIRALRNAEVLEEQEDKRKLRMKNLPLDLQMRHEEAVEVAAEIRARAEEAEEGELDILDETIAKLDYLLDQYADMLVSMHQTSELLKDPEAESLEGRVTSLEQEIESMEPGRVRKAKEKNLAILRQRALSFAKSAEEVEYFEVSLNTLENTLKLVRDRVIAASTAGAISSSLDDVVLELSAHRDYMESVEAAREEPRAEAAPRVAPFEGTTADPQAQPVVEADISAPPISGDEEERPPGILEEWSKE